MHGPRYSGSYAQVMEALRSKYIFFPYTAVRNTHTLIILNPSRENAIRVLTIETNLRGAHPALYHLLLFFVLFQQQVIRLQQYAHPFAEAMHSLLLF